jgi:hypothetical protein
MYLSTGTPLQYSVIVLLVGHILAITSGSWNTRDHGLSGTTLSVGHHLGGVGQQG